MKETTSFDVKIKLFFTGKVIKTKLSFEKYNVFVTFTKQEINENINNTVINTKYALKFNVWTNENKPNVTTNDNKILIMYVIAINMIIEYTVLKRKCLFFL